MRRGTPMGLNLWFQSDRGLVRVPTTKYELGGSEWH